MPAPLARYFTKKNVIIAGVYHHLKLALGASRLDCAVVKVVLCACVNYISCSMFDRRMGRTRIQVFFTI